MTESTASEEWVKVAGPHLHPALGRVLGQGYEIAYHIEHEGKHFSCLAVRVSYQGQVVAEADFTDDGRDAYCQNVKVREGDRRKGIATAAYVLAEKILGKLLYDFWGGDDKQSAAAKALWSQPGRPFGTSS